MSSTPKASLTNRSMESCQRDSAPDSVKSLRLTQYPNICLVLFRFGVAAFFAGFAAGFLTTFFLLRGVFIKSPFFIFLRFPRDSRARPLLRVTYARYLESRVSNPARVVSRLCHSHSLPLVDTPSPARLRIFLYNPLFPTYQDIGHSLLTILDG